VVECLARAAQSETVAARIVRAIKNSPALLQENAGEH
jgi:hypothetical protein